MARGPRPVMTVLISQTYVSWHYTLVWAVNHRGAGFKKSKAWMAVGGPAVSSTAMAGWAGR
jgi:hypothetical protein